MLPTVIKSPSATVRGVLNRPPTSAPDARDPDLRRLRDRAYLALVPLVLDVVYAALVARRYRRALVARAARRVRDRTP